MVRLKLLVLFLVLLVAPACAQQTTETKKFESSKYLVSYPAGWVVTEEGKIVNIFPDSERGAVTISDYSGIDFPLEETKAFVLEMHELSGDPNSVTMKEANGAFEFTHEFTNRVKNERWYTRVVRKGKDFFLITINCPEDKWAKQRNILFSVVDSFKIK